MAKTVRIGSVNEGSTLKAALRVDYHLTSPSEVLAQVDRSLEVLEGIVHRAGQAGCDIAVFPETTLSLSYWEAAHPERVGEVLPEAVARMLQRLGGAAAAHNMYLICCNDTFEGGVVRNTAFFLGRDGKEIGRYHKVMLPLHEQLKQQGDAFPVFQTPDLGGVGILICYDMVFPETARCLALNGADIIFNPTEGGAAFGGEDISRAAFRTRAVENLVYVVVSWGGGNNRTGSMIISPMGEVLADEREPGALAMADIDPFGGRRVADFANWQEDMRARIFRERQPQAYAVLTAPCPPVMDKLPAIVPGSAQEIARIYHRAITMGHVHYDQAEEYLREGKTAEAIAAYEALRIEYPRTWFDRMACERLAKLREEGKGA